MTVFIDASVIVHSAVDADVREPCLEILDAIARGELDGRTTTAVLEEVWHVETSGRAGPMAGLAHRAYILLTPLLAVEDGAFRRALSLDAPQLRTNDRLHVGTCLAHGIGVVVSADRDFDTVGDLRRIDPLDAEARRGMLEAWR